MFEIGTKYKIDNFLLIILFTLSVFGRTAARSRPLPVLKKESRFNTSKGFKVNQSGGQIKRDRSDEFGALIIKCMGETATWSLQGLEPKHF